MPKNKSQKDAIAFSSIAAIIVIVAVTAIVSVYATMKFTSPKIPVSTTTPLASSKVESSPTIIPSPTPDITADWKTYSDNKIGFEFKYPLEWIYSVEQNDIMFREEDKGLLEIFTLKKFELQKNQTFQDILIKNITLGESDKNPVFSDFKPMKIGNENFYYIFPYLSEGQYSVSYWYIKESTILQFELYADAQGDWQSDIWKVEDQTSFKKLNQILSTFKPTNNADTANLKTYKNTSLGISFNYPANATLDNESTNGIIIKLLNRAELNISNLAFGLEGYGSNLPDYPDKEISSGHTRTVKSYGSAPNKSIVYWIIIDTDKQNNNWSASSMISESQLNEETIASFDQIITTFKIIK